MASAVITVAPFGHASVSRPVEEAALDCEFPGPSQLMVQTTMKDFLRKREHTPPPSEAPRKKHPKKKRKTKDRERKEESRYDE